MRDTFCDRTPQRERAKRADMSELECVICNHEITGEQKLRRCPGPLLGKNVVSCAGCGNECWHADCLLRWLESGRQGFRPHCPICRLGNRPFEAKPVVHPRSSELELDCMSNFLLRKEVDRALPPRLERVEKLAEEHEASRRVMEYPAYEMRDLAASCLQEARERAEARLVDVRHPPILLEGISGLGPQWRRLLHGVWRSDGKAPGDWASLPIRAQVERELRLRFGERADALRRRRMQALHDAQREEHLRAFREGRAVHAVVVAKSSWPDRGSMERYLLEALDIDRFFMRYYQMHCLPSLLTALRKQCGTVFNDSNVFRVAMYPANRLSEAQVEELTEFFRATAREAFAKLDADAAAAAEV